MTDSLSSVCTESSTLSEIHLTEKEVHKALANLETRKAQGPDNIPTLVLKECAKELSTSLCHLFNQSLSTGNLPSEWKTSLNVPVHKKQCKENVANYRPISLLCITSKVLERCVFQHIMKHFSKLLHDSQHGFLKGRSTVTQLLGFLHEIGQAIDKGQQSDVIYLDFAKAFDSVSHPRLILKLHHYGIRGKLLGWLENYLTNRSQRTVLQGVTCAPLPVLSGVPQGSILGPLLFLVYINDLPSVINCDSSIGLFADDSKCFKTILDSQDCTNLQNDLDAISEWSKVFALTPLNANCSLLHVNATLSCMSTCWTLNYLPDPLRKRT